MDVVVRFGWLDIVAIVVALAFAVVGAWRGFRRAIVVLLAGIVLGVMMGTLWADAWGGFLADKWGFAETTVQGALRLGSLLIILIVVGYGSSLFFPPRRDVPFSRHLLGGLVGLFNGLLLQAFSYQYIQEYFQEGTPDSVLQTSPIARVLVRWLPGVFLGLFAVVLLAVIAAVGVRVYRIVTRLEEEPAEEAAPARPEDVVSPPVVREPPPPIPAPPAPAVEEPPIVGEGVGLSCPNCGQPISTDSAYCPQCGKILG